MDILIHIILLLITFIISYNIVYIIPTYFLDILLNTIKDIVRLLCLVILKVLPLPSKNISTLIQYHYYYIYYMFKDIDLKSSSSLPSTTTTSLSSLSLSSSIIMYKILKILYDNSDNNDISSIPIKVKSRSRKDQLLQSLQSYTKILSKSISGITVDLSTKDINDFIIPINKNLLNLLNNNDKTHMLCLDLDETLIHSSLVSKHNNDHELLLYDEEHRQYFYVFKRPFVDLFLTTLSYYYNISVFTASYSCYSSPIMTYIDPYQLITNKYYNTSLKKADNGLEKDLTIVSKSHTPNKIIMIDNSKTACITHRENLYLIKSYVADKNNDIELLSLIPLLLALSSSNISDTRAILHRRCRNKENNDNNDKNNDNNNNILSNAHTDTTTINNKNDNKSDNKIPKKVSVKL